MQNRWNAAHRLDAAHSFRLALENAEPGARYHASAGEAITVKSVVETIGKQLNIPVQSITPEAAAEHFGWFAQMAAIDCPSSSKWTRDTLNWQPTHATLLTDIEGNVYT